MIVYHQQAEAKSAFIVMTKQQKTFSSNWKPFGFRSADAHTRTRVRAGGGVEPAARSSHKPPDAQKEAAKKAKNCAKRREERRNLCEQGKNRETRPAAPPPGPQPRSFCPRFSAFAALSDGAAAHAVQERQTKAPQPRRKQAEMEDEKQQRTHFISFLTIFGLFFAGDVCARARWGKKKGCVPRGGPRAFR